MSAADDVIYRILHHALGYDIPADWTPHRPKTDHCFVCEEFRCTRCQEHCKKCGPPATLQEVQQAEDESEHNRRRQLTRLRRRRYTL